MLKNTLCLFTLSLAATLCHAEHEAVAKTASTPAVVETAASAKSTAAAEPTPAAKPAAQDFNGIWSDVGGQDFQYCYLILAQEGTTIHSAHYIEFHGVPMVEYGVGTVKDGTLTLNVKVTKPIPGWATAGVHTLHLSADGNVMRGEYADAKGNKGPLAFGRFRQKH